VEGLVADYDLTLGDLIGTIKTFFERIGEGDFCIFYVYI
jgi:phenylalanyl-tRNA synthetase alpha subunit